MTFVMMQVSAAFETKDNDHLLKNEGNATTLTIITTFSSPTETPTPQQQQQQQTTEDTPLKYFSMDDAIEAFRKPLINSEMDIGGIVEAEKPFYRHFNLKYVNANINVNANNNSLCL
ncbi:uncharacterized protein LOC119643713 [Glossina fuscipes]|uniref:Uncharacterized protein LOC119643713 n=1 Tax=Glossina fuscipes TaxID=7396 RepID=A0A9C5ZGA6_9MUSC|nr:uncharacterized protein LOC119643713 [Glossina fuscipes]